MKEWGWGRIINISGGNARNAGNLSGGARNAGLVQMTKTLAVQLGRHGITVNCIHPGTTRTERTPSLLAARATAEIAGVAGVAAADVDDAAPARILHERDDSAGTAQRPDILHVEILDQILVDNRFDRTGRGGGAPWRGPAVHQDMQAAQLLRRLSDHAVYLLPAGDIGREGEDAPVRLGGQLSRCCLQIRLVARYNRHIGPFASQFPGYGFANAPTTAGHDRMLVLQSEVHGILSLIGWRGSGVNG